MSGSQPSDIDAFLARERNRSRPGKLKGYASEIMELHARGASTRDTAKYLKERFALVVSSQAIGRFINARIAKGLATASQQPGVGGPESTANTVSSPQRLDEPAGCSDTFPSQAAPRLPAARPLGIDNRVQHMDAPLAGVVPSGSVGPNVIDSGPAFSHHPSPPPRYDGDNGSGGSRDHLITNIPVIVTRVDFDMTTPDVLAVRNRRQLDLLTGRHEITQGDHVPNPSIFLKEK